MTTIKSISVSEGDMFYIIHNSDNFTQIDCNMEENTINKIIDDVKAASQGKGVCRFISTHPDEDHLKGLKRLDEEMNILNFYCVRNNVKKDSETTDFKHYKSLRDDEKKAFYLYKGCKRRWMNESSAERGCAGINVHWPDRYSKSFQDALRIADSGKGANNISPIITYSLENGVNAMWMGDLEKDFLEKIENEVEWRPQNILFVPHHGRKSGRVPNSILGKIEPDIVVIGEGPSDELDYYKGYNKITQNSAKDIWFECESQWVDIYVSSNTYKVDFLTNKGLQSYGDRRYLGSLEVK